MRRLLTGYAVSFNRRHRRAGHLFQNRFKSIVVEEEPYLLELVRYIHLNPLRAHLVPDLGALDTYPWSGHATLLASRSQSWQDTDFVLAHFGARVRQRRGQVRAKRASPTGTTKTTKMHYATTAEHSRGLDSQCARTEPGGAETL